VGSTVLALSPTVRSEAVLPHFGVQNFFRSYPKLAGMTGTAATEAEEFASTYDLQVTVVPTNRVRAAPGLVWRDA